MRFERMAYGARIKQLRASKGLTQEQLAEKIHISRTYAVKIESGAQVGPVELAVELAEIFEVSLDFLLLGKGYAGRGYHYAVFKGSKAYDFPRESGSCQSWRTGRWANKKRH